MKTVLTYGTFDLFHIGHLRLLQRLAGMGERLIVGVSTDEFNAVKKKKTIIPYEQRSAIVENIKGVDIVVPEYCWEQKKSDIEEVSEEPEVTEDDSELFDLILEEKPEEVEEKVEEKVGEPLDLISEEKETFDLGISEEEAETVAEESGEILIDIDRISQQIGVSHEDYDTFLNEYIDTALGLEEDLKSTDAQKRSSAVSTLSHLSEVLQLPVIGDLIENVGTASTDTQKEAGERFSRKTGGGSCRILQQGICRQKYQHGGFVGNGMDEL